MFRIYNFVLVSAFVSLSAFGAETLNTNTLTTTNALDAALVTIDEPEQPDNPLIENQNLASPLTSFDTNSPKSAIGDFGAQAAPGGGGGGGPGEGNGLGPASEDIFARLNTDFTVSPHTTDLLGDSVDINNGNVSFNHTDLVASGNGPDIIISRKLQGAAYSPFRQANFGDWSLDVPAIQTTLLKSTSRYSGAWGLGYACSGEISPGPLYNLGKTYQEHEYWNGDSLIMPGGNSEQLLENTTSRLASNSIYKRVTKSNWKFSCISVSGVGEGFLGYSPDGLKYTFSKYRLIQGGLIGSTPKYNAFMMVTKVEDRFGNYVNYNYTGNNLTSITSSDLRRVDLTYGTGAEANFIQTVSYNGRVWQYDYSGNSLVEVTRPDGKSWEYDIANYPGTNMVAWNGSTCSFNEPFFPDFSGTITHPDGAMGTFTFSGQMHGRSNVKQTRLQINVAEFVQCPDYANYALKSKTLTGPGLTPQTWQYSYSGNDGTWDFTAPTSAHNLAGARPPSIDAENNKSTTVTAPDGSKYVYFYNRDFTSYKEGSLMAIDVYDTNGSTLLSRKEDSFGTEGGSFGFTGTMYENNWPSVARTNKTQSKVTRGSNTFTTSYSDFGTYGNPQFTNEVNNFNGKARYTKQTYLDDTTNWLIGLPSQTYVSTTTSFSSTPVSETTYHSATGSYKSLPNEKRSFGRWYKRNTSYHTSGADNRGLPNKVDYNGSNRWVYFSNYKRGIAQTIQTPQSLSASPQFAYNVVDNNGWVTQQWDFEGHCFRYEYDSLGRMDLFDPCNADWYNTSVDYSTTSGSDGFTYVEAGMLKQTVSKGNYRKVTYFDSLLRPRMTKEWDTARETETKRYTRADYDARNQPTYQSKPHGLNDTPYGVNTTYDGLGRPLVVDDNTTSGSISYSYLSNNRVQVNDNEGNVTTTTYLAYGSPSQSMATSIASPQSVTTTMAYNIYGNMTSVSQGGITESRVYDGYQQLCKTIRPDVGNSAFGYDNIGQMLWKASGSSVSSSLVCASEASVSGYDKTTLAYDYLGNTKSISFGDGTPTKTFGYDKNNNLTSLTYGGVLQDYTYNDLNLPETERLRVDGLDWTIENSYDAYANQSNFIYPSGGNLGYEPNALGQPTRVGVFATNVTFHPNGQYASYTQLNGCVNTMSLYNSGLPNTQRSLCGSTNAVYNQYTFDANGNVLFWDDKESNTYDLRFTYDGLDRLDNIRKADQTLIGDMNYDTMGNITKFDSIAGTINYAYDSSKRLQSTSGMRAYDFNYDARGNVTDSGYHSFTYNLAEQMIEADGNTYLYDGLNKRVKTIDGTGTRYSMYSLAGKLVYERIDGANRENYYMGSQLVAHQGAGSQTFIHPDLMGTTAAKSNSSGTVTKRLRYAPFGLEWGATNAESGENEIGYTGHKHDKDIGLTYMQARYYDPVIGRFYSSDPLGYGIFNPVMSFSRYLYVNNNSYKYTDPTGMIMSCVNENGMQHCTSIQKRPKNPTNNPFDMKVMSMIARHEIDQNMNGQNSNNSSSLTCIGTARVLEGNPALIGRKGGFSGTTVGVFPVKANSAAIDNSQWTGDKALTRPFMYQIAGSTLGGQSFNGVTDIIGSSDVNNVREMLRARNAGSLVLELVSGQDEGTTAINLSVPNSIGCPTGTSSY